MVLDSMRGLRLLALIALTPTLLGTTGFRADFNQRILAAHNSERAKLGVEPLRWNPQLAEGARDWARHLSRTGRFEHSPDAPGAEPEGENIWGGTPRYFSPEAMVRLWVKEKRHFKPGVFPANSRTGDVRDVSHYTQVMWRESKAVGCAVSAIGKEEILVCRYSQAGNREGEMPF